jgi:hypothetical protein
MSLKRRKMYSSSSMVLTGSKNNGFVKQSLMRISGFLRLSINSAFMPRKESLRMNCGMRGLRSRGSSLRRGIIRVLRLNGAWKSQKIREGEVSRGIGADFAPRKKGNCVVTHIPYNRIKTINTRLGQQAASGLAIGSCPSSMPNPANSNNTNKQPQQQSQGFTTEIVDIDCREP